jgi:hypothetical protein
VWESVAMSDALLAEVWVPLGVPGFAGAAKAARAALLNGRFGADGWRYGHFVRGRIVPPSVAIREYEEAYRQYLRTTPAIVEFLVRECGNVYDWSPTNVHDDAYEQPHTEMNHYQDISVRRVIAELVDDPAWPSVTDTPVEVVSLRDLGTGLVHSLPRARGFRGDGLLEIRGATSPGFVLNPALVPVHDPALVVNSGDTSGWFMQEGCGHLSVEAFWQMSKVVEVRYDRFLALAPADRERPLEGM